MTENADQFEDRGADPATDPATAPATDAAAAPGAGSRLPHGDPVSNIEDEAAAGGGPELAAEDQKDAELTD